MSGTSGAVSSSSLDLTGFTPPFGYKVSKTENIATATGVDLFTVTGKIIITMWIGEVTVQAYTTQPTDYKIRIKTANVDLFAATNLSSAALGYMWALSDRASFTLLTGSTYADTVVKATDNIGVPMANRVIGLAGGSLVLQSLRTAGNASDAMVHSLWYLPLEAGAGVVAA